MVKLYTQLIIEHRRSFDEIPKRHQEAVKKRLAEKGYTTEGEPIA